MQSTGHWSKVVKKDQNLYSQIDKNIVFWVCMFKNTCPILAKFDSTMSCVMKFGFQIQTLSQLETYGS